MIISQFIAILNKKYEQAKIPEQHHTQVLFGDFSILAQSSIVISVPSFKENTNRSSPMTATRSTTACQSFSANSMGVR